MNSKDNTKVDRSLYISCKLPKSLKSKLDSITCGDGAVFKKTALIRYLLSEFFDAKENGRKIINLERII